MTPTPPLTDTERQEARKIAYAYMPEMGYETDKDSMWGDLQRVCRALLASEAECAELRKDKERMDWLQEGGIDDFTRDRDNYGIESGKIFSWGDSKEENRLYDTLREAIDARRAEARAHE